MLSLNDIRSYYPKSLQQYERFILREYLQYKILEIVFDSPFANQLSFLGGICLRIVHNNTRFSEDIDFDNFNLTFDGFIRITKLVQSEMQKLGCKVDIQNVRKGAYHCYVRFQDLLFEEGLSKHKEEKILIKLDSIAHDFYYPVDKPILNKFDVFTQINSTPKDLLLSQKFYAILNRKRNKGRDFFDVLFLLGKEQVPNYEYLNAKTGISNPEELKESILRKCHAIEMKEMAYDVQPFLFDVKDTKKVLLFSEYIEQMPLK